MPGRAPRPGAVPRLLERNGIGRFIHLRSFVDRGNHELVRSVYLAILAVKCALLAVRCSVHERKWPARPTDRTQAAALTAWSPQIGIGERHREALDRTRPLILSRSGTIRAWHGCDSSESTKLLDNCRATIDIAGIWYFAIHVGRQ
jgi:hypothetical protein